MSLVVGALAIVVGGTLALRPAANIAAVGAPEIAAEVPATAMDHAIGPANNSPTLLADPGDERFVVMANRLDAPDFSCSLQVSGDGGRGWRSVQPVRNLPAGAEKCYAPEVAFDASGRLYYLFVGLAGRGNEPVGAFLTSSDDRGRTFSPPRAVLGPLNFAVRLAVDQEGNHGRIHLVWIKASSDPPLGGFGPPPNPIMAAYSDDGGESFSDPVQVSDVSRERVVAPALALGADGAVHVAYYDLHQDVIDYQGLEGDVWEGNWSVVVASSYDRGARFGAGSVVDDGVVPNERVMLIFTMPPPALAVDGRRRCVAWTDARHGDADVLLRCSSGGGAWNEPVRVNDDPVGSGRSQYLPKLAMAPDGRIDAVFYDRRLDPHNVLNDVAFTFSTDGGRSFAPTMKLTSDAFNVTIGQQYVHPAATGQVEFGSRLALLSRPGSAIAAWPDTRNSRLGGTSQDLFAAAVEFPAIRPTWGRPVGLGLGLSGVLLLSLCAYRMRHSSSRAEAVSLIQDPQQ